jgi:hypothetical protein
MPSLGSILEERWRGMSEEQVASEKMELRRLLKE